jgi:hypothetical protein
MARLLSIPIIQVIGVLFIVSLLLFLISLVLLRRSRKGPYWRARRVAGDRGGRLLIVSAVLFVSTLALAFFGGFAIIALGGPSAVIPRDPNALAGVVLPSPMPTTDPNASPTPTAEATADLIETDTPPSATQAPTDQPSTVQPTETRAATHAATAIPTNAPTQGFAAALQLTPITPLREPRDSASMELTAADNELSADQTPIQARDRFEPGIERIYLWYNYRDMDDGVVWSRVLYRDGVPVQGANYLWSLDTEGSHFFFFGDDDGYPPGSYEARLFIGENEVSRITFTIG